MYCALPLKRDGECTVVAVPDADNAAHLTRLREALHGPIRLVTAARSDIKDAIERIHEPRGTITQMALAEARAQVAPQPARAPVYRIEVTLESGATLLVAQASDFEEAKAIGMRVIDEAEAGGTVAGGDATIDGRQVVSVDVLGRTQLRPLTPPPPGSRTVSSSRSASLVVVLQLTNAGRNPTTFARRVVST